MPKPTETNETRVIGALARLTPILRGDVDRDVTGTAVERLASLATVQYAVEQAQLIAVQEAIDAGETWAAIGAAQGITRQAAQQKWSPRLRASRLV